VARSSQKSAVDEYFLPAVRVLFQGITECIARDDSGRHSPVKTDISELILHEENDYYAPEIETKANTAVRVLRECSVRTARYHHGRFSEQRSIIGALLDLLQDLTVAGPDTMRKLREVRSQIESATDMELLQKAKLELSKCLEQVKEEAGKQIGLVGDESARDSATKLPGRPHAEVALAAACAEPKPNCVAIILIDRLALYNRRYGREVGDGVLRHYATLLQTTFDPRDLFRWTGPALVMLRPGTAEKVQAELRRSLDARAKFEIEIGERAILLPLDASWQVIPALPDPRLVINKIEAFVNG
jgi:GGDEF domain-containing protein